MKKLLQKVIFVVIVLFLIGGMFSALSSFSGIDFKGINPLFFLKDIQNNISDKIIPKDEKNQSKQPEVLVKFALMSDSHTDITYLNKAINKIKNLRADFVVHLGDWSQVGTQAELKGSKEIFDESDLKYWTVPGDHDLWASNSTTNFRAVFGDPYSSFDKSGVHGILLDTSDTDVGLGETQLSWLKKDLAENRGKIIFAFMHLPPYHPTSNRTMWEKGGVNSKVREEADEMLKWFGDYKVKGIFAGDHHLSSSFTEPTSGVKITIVGAITSSRNLQIPRFDLVTVYKNSDYNVEEVVLE